jgi:hypothetical protein
LTGSQYPERPALTVVAQQQLQMTEVLAELPLSEKIDLGFKITDLIVDCTYDKAPCDMEKFVVFIGIFMLDKISLKRHS